MFIIKKNKKWKQYQKLYIYILILIQLFSMTVTSSFYQYKSIKASQYLCERCEAALF